MSPSFPACLNSRIGLAFPAVSDLKRLGFILLYVSSLLAVPPTSAAADEKLEFFEKKIRPVLVEHCYGCHSADAKELAGGLRLDLRSGWQAGGDSGQPAIVPGKPDESPLWRAMRHAPDASAMPPKQARLPAAVLDDFQRWIEAGAVDPRDGQVQRRDKAADWEAAFRERLDWWSLKPIKKVAPPDVAGRAAAWPRTDLDRFIVARLDSQGLAPAREADRRTLVRRLSYALHGLPPSRELLEQFASTNDDASYDALVSALLESPHFGERWARHWMDVVHYTDTHGYEWDVPVKNGWRYRDYLIRAFNADLPYRRLVLEHIAGDLIPPRIDAATGVNEALLGPLSLRLGERRHGDSAAAEGVTQEGVANMIDTLGKAFLGTTLACAQCHDHKLDAVEQRDYYSLAGMLMSTRFSVRTIDTVDPNESLISEMRTIKARLRAELSKSWLAAFDRDASDGVAAKLRAIPADEKPAAAFPSSLVEFWKRSRHQPPLAAADFAAQRSARRDANAKQLTLLADFTREDGAPQWRWDGFGMKHGLVGSGELVVGLEGATVVQHLLPAGRFTHVWSPRLGGSLQSTQLDPLQPVTFSLELTAGKAASLSFIVDRALNSERLQYPNRPTPGWHTLTAGNFDTLEGTLDKTPRRVYLELVTKSHDNYFPPRVGYGGLSEAELPDPRSWFGVTRIYQHAPGQTPQDDLGRFEPLFQSLEAEPDWDWRLTRLLRNAVDRWSRGECTDEDVKLINEALVQKLLPNDLSAQPAEVRAAVEAYRALERRVVEEQTIGSAADWNEGRNDRIGIRGSYTELGDETERGRVRFLGTPTARRQAASSGRLEWAEQLVAPDNPLVARVYVNRVWHYLCGEGLVRTTDDFGHLGEPPVHPELLDYLAARFIEQGWSTKQLIRDIVCSSMWRQHSVPTPPAAETDPENRLWSRMPLRRLEAEAIRDALLAVSGRLDRRRYGPPVEPFRTAEDSQKRLFRGPLDGQGRRSLYLEMTLMEPPRFLALFNQPLPKQTVGRRDVTNVPDQALALLNDPFVHAMAEAWSQRLVADGAGSIEQRAARMIEDALSRPATADETSGLSNLVRESIRLRGDSTPALASVPAWKDAAHAIFNLKEFIYIP
ncbi:MAG: PSD1 and planctomycete cytochrome C domain-containing protein [Pirellulales bacterium]